MTSNNKHLARAAAALTLVASMATPLAALAQTRATSSPDRTPGANFCTRINELSTVVRAKRDEQRTRLTTQRDQRGDERESSQRDRLAKITELRAASDAKREEVTEKLRDMATTTAQRTAIEKFQVEVRTAVTARRSAIQTANAAFRSGIQALIAKRKTAVDAAVKTFHDAVFAAASKAKTDCGSGIAPGTIRETYLAAVRTAKEKLVKDVQAIERTGEDVQALIATRRAAHAKAVADFTAAMDKARADLKAAFGA